MTTAAVPCPTTMKPITSEGVGAENVKLAEVHLGMLFANIVVLPLTIACCVAGILLAHTHPRYLPFADSHVFVTCLCLLVSIPLHEAIHAFGLRFLAGIHWRHISYGVHWRIATPYCHCSVPISIRAYCQMALLPLWVLGSLTFVGLLLFPTDCQGVLLGLTIAGCIGDVWIVLKLRRFSADLLALDSPTEIGCDVLAPVRH